MARLNKRTALNNISGQIGKELVFKQYADKIVVSKYPDMTKVVASEKQKLQRDLMKAAIDYARSVKRDPVLKAIYEKDLKPGESIYHKAKQDFFKKIKRS